MKQIIIAAAALCWLGALTAFAQEPVMFRDDFSKYANGADGSPVWKPFLGKWEVKDGRYFQSVNDQYDQGSSLAIQPKGRYTISVKVKAEGGPAGGGLFWNMTNRETRANCQMVRVDPEFVIWGWEDTQGNFQQTGIFNTGVTSDSEHTLSVAVDPELGKYNVLLDGKIVGRNADLRYYEGYCGIQSSLANSFDDFEVRPAKAVELEGLEIVKPFNSPRALAMGQLDRLYVGHRGKNTITVVSTGDPLSALPYTFGSVVHEFAPRGKGEGEMLDPVALVFDREGNLLALDRQRNSVNVFDRTGRFVRSFSTYFLFNPTDMALLPGGEVVVVSPGSNAVAVFSPEGKQLASVSDSNVFKGPETVTVDAGGRILVGDPGNHRIVVFSYGSDGQLRQGGTIPAWLIGSSLRTNSKGELFYAGGLGYYEAGGCVRSITQRGQRLSHFAGFSIGGLSREGGLVVGPNDVVYYADTTANRIVMIPPDLSEPRPRVDVAGDGATITWATPGLPGWNTPDSPVAFRYGTDKKGDTWHSMNVVAASAAISASGKDERTLGPAVTRRVTLSKLKPNTTYYYTFSPTVTTIPAGDPAVEASAEISRFKKTVDPTYSKTYSFLSAPPKGQRQYVTLRVLNAIYLKTDNKGVKFEAKREDIGDRIRLMAERAKEFYWRNTGFRLNLEMDYVVIDEAVADIKEAIPPLEQVRKDVAAATDFAGRKVANYDSINAIWLTPRYSKDQKEQLGRVGGGGLTPYGYSAFAADGMVAWLIVHEYNHQVDAFFDRAGYPEFWLNHPDETIHSGRFGGQYDCNAWIFREWPDNDWFLLPANGVGRLDVTADSDEDGLPDNEPKVSIDERRFGSDPRKTDSDSDGLDDLKEAMAGIFSGTNPRKADTDGDGVPDARDPWPLDPEMQNRPRRTPIIDGAVLPDEWAPLKTINQDGLKAETYLQWDENAVYFAVITDAMPSIEVHLTPKNTGIFTSDKIECRINARQAGPEAKDVEVVNGKGARAVVRRTGGKTTVEVAFPRIPTIGLAPQMEQTMGFNAIFETESSWVTLFEPWRLWEMRLVSD